jgi:hypothetical protein
VFELDDGYRGDVRLGVHISVFLSGMLILNGIFSQWPAFSVSPLDGMLALQWHLFSTCCIV